MTVYVVEQGCYSDRMIVGAVIGYFMAALTKTAKTYSEEDER